MRSSHPWIVFSFVALAFLRQSVPAWADTEETQFRAAEKLRQQGLYPQAAQAYRRMLKAFLAGAHRHQVIQKLDHIACFWLEDTWAQFRRMQQPTPIQQALWAVFGDHLDSFLPSDEAREALWSALGGNLAVYLSDERKVLQNLLYCWHLLHWDQRKPWLNEEQEALALLAFVEVADPTGPWADRSLYLRGHVHIFREDYRQADGCLTRLFERYPASKYACEAMEKAVHVRLMIKEDSPEKQSRHLAGIRALIEKCLHRDGFPEEQKQRLGSLRVVVHLQQARLDIQQAEKWRRAGQMDRARQQYEDVCRRSPGTPAAEEARLRLREMEKSLPKER